MPYAMPSHCISCHLLKLVNAGGAAPLGSPKRNRQARVLSKEWLSRAFSASAILIGQWPAPAQRFALSPPLPVLAGRQTAWPQTSGFASISKDNNYDHQQSPAMPTLSTRR